MVRQKHPQRIHLPKQAAGKSAGVVRTIVILPNTTLSDSQRAECSELLRRDPPHHRLMTQPLRDLSVYHWQSTTTPIGARGKKGRVGDPVGAGCDDVAARDTSENSWPT